jgi:hypothetical protein
MVEAEDDCSSPIFLPDAQTYINVQIHVPTDVYVYKKISEYEVMQYTFFTLHIKKRNTGVSPFFVRNMQ